MEQARKPQGQPVAAIVFAIGIATLLAIPALTSPSPTSTPRKPVSFAVIAEPEKGRPLPIAPPERPITAELDCNRGGGAIFLSGGPICIYSNTWPNSASWTGEILGSRARPYERRLSGAVVQIHVETLTAPVRAITDRWGQYAFVNLPMRRNGITCASQSVEVSGYGDYLQKTIAMYGGRWGQSIELYGSEPRIGRNTYHMPKRCLRYESPLKVSDTRL